MHADCGVSTTRERLFLGSSGWSELPDVKNAVCISIAVLVK